MDKMSHTPRISVMETLDNLAKRLDPIIQEKLAVHLGGHPWTVIIDELDKNKGHIKAPQNRTDLQPQLRVLTEKLGSLGFPFDANGRIVSTLGNELRIVRNSFAHQNPFDWIDSFRAADFSVRLLENFGDKEGLDAALIIRDKALKEVVKESGLVPTRPTIESLTRTVEASPDDEVEDEMVKPDAETMVRATSVDTPITGNDRYDYEAWSPVVVGDYELLKELPKKKAKELVRAVAAEIVEFEGPIHVDRLVQLIAASFDVSKLGDKRKNQIISQIKATGLAIDDSRFVWPAAIDRTTWNEFRPCDSTVNRSFLQISPIEIRNAARFLKNRNEDISPDELKVRVLRTFGKKRLTKSRATHMAHAMNLV